MFLKGILLFCFLVFLVSHSIFSKEVYVSVSGNDSSSGTKESRFATFERAVAENMPIPGKESVTECFSKETTVRATKGGDFRIYSNGTLSKVISLKRGESITL